MLGVHCVAGYEAAGNNEHRAEKVPPQSKLNDSRGEKTDRQSGKGYEGGQGNPDMDYGHIVHKDGKRRLLLSDHIHRYIFKSGSRMGT